MSPEGYTLEEACTLARSSQAKQRVLALKLLATVLGTARPKPSHVMPDGLLQSQAMHPLQNALEVSQALLYDLATVTIAVCFLPQCRHHCLVAQCCMLFARLHRRSGYVLLLDRTLSHQRVPV